MTQGGRNTLLGYPHTNRPGDGILHRLKQRERGFKLGKKGVGSSRRQQHPHVICTYMHICVLPINCLDHNAVIGLYIYTRIRYMLSCMGVYLCNAYRHNLMCVNCLRVCDVIWIIFCHVSYLQITWHLPSYRFQIYENDFGEYVLLNWRWLLLRTWSCWWGVRVMLYVLIMAPMLHAIEASDSRGVLID